MFFKKDYIALFFLSLLFLTTHFVGVDRGFWQDEFISLNSLNNNFFINPLYFGYTTNLPLYFVLLKIITSWGFFTNFFYLRFISIIISYFTTLSIYFFLKKEFGFYFSLIFTILFIITPLQIHYSQEVRPYALTEFIIILNLIFFYYFYKGRVHHVVLFSGVFLGFFTHYSVIIFLLILYLLSSIYFYIFRYFKLLKTASATFLFCLILSIILFLIYSINPSFVSSLNSSVEGGINLYRILEFPINFVTVGIIKIKEVISFYYFYGIWYYLVDPLFQSIFKKLVLLAFFSGFIYEIYSFYRSKTINIYWIIFVLFFSVIFISYLLEFLGIYPFGGRHIFAFSPLFYFILLYPARILPKKIKMITIFFICILIPFFVFHQFCANYVAKATTKIEDKDAYGFCSSKYKNILKFN